MSLIGSVFGSTMQAATSTAIAKKNYRSQQETNATNLQIARETNQANLDLAREQNQFNLEQWDRANEYNDPANQAARLRGAGLSSAAAAQAVAGVPASPVQSANLSNQQIPGPLPAPSLDANAFNMLEVIRSAVEISKDFSEAKILEKKAQIEPKLMLTELDVKRQSLEAAQAKFAYDTAAYPHHLRRIEYEANASKYLEQQMKLNNKERKVQIQLLRQQFGFLEKMNDEQLRKIREEIDNLGEQRKVYQAQKENIEQNTQVLRAQVGNIEADTANKRVENRILNQQERIKKIEAIMQENGMPETFTQRVGICIKEGVISEQDVWKALFAMKDYLQSGCKVFRSGADEQFYQFYDYIINEGRAKSRSLGGQTTGAWRDFADDILRGVGYLR